MASRINHVSINALDLRESVDFYVDLLAAGRARRPTSACPCSGSPGDVVQLYVRDPAGNLVEIDHHGVQRLPEDMRA